MYLSLSQPACRWFKIGSEVPWPAKHKPKRHKCLSLSEYPHSCEPVSVNQFQGGLSILLHWALEAAPSIPFLTSDAVPQLMDISSPLKSLVLAEKPESFWDRFTSDVTNTFAASNPHSTPKMTCCIKRQDVREWPHYFRTIKDILKLLLKLQGRLLEGGEETRNSASACWHTCCTKGN